MSAEKKIETTSKDELDDIVNDIGKLKDELEKTATSSPAAPHLALVPDPAAAPAPTPDAELQEFRGSSDEASLEETLGSMKEEEPTSGKSLLDVTPPSPEVEAEPSASTEVVEDSEEEKQVEAEVEAEVSRELKNVDDTDSSEDGSLTMKLTGKMKLTLNYEYSGQEVTVQFDDEFLIVQMADGTEFKIPVHKKSSSSQAA